VHPSGMCGSTFKTMISASLPNVASGKALASVVSAASVTVAGIVSGCSDEEEEEEVVRTTMCCLRRAAAAAVVVDAGGSTTMNAVHSTTVKASHRLL